MTLTPQQLCLAVVTAYPSGGVTVFEARDATDDMPAVEQHIEWGDNTPLTDEQLQAAYDTYTATQTAQAAADADAAIIAQIQDLQMQQASPIREIALSNTAVGADGNTPMQRLQNIATQIATLVGQIQGEVPSWLAHL